MNLFDQIYFFGSLVFFVVWAVMILRYYSHGKKLFELLSKVTPEYYESLGKPGYRTINILRNHRASRYLSDIVFKGLPDNFPDNKDARRMAEESKAQGRRVYAFFAIFFIATLLHGTFA